MTSRHESEAERNVAVWQRKQLLRDVYAAFYRRIAAQVDRSVAGRIVEIGSGVGNFRELYGDAIATDMFVEPWLDLACNAYELPLRDRSVSHLVLFDVFHHLAAPMAFLTEARRVLAAGGRVILFDPYISAASYPVYGLLHPEPVARKQPIDLTSTTKPPAGYYAAQGNATRIFFEGRRGIDGWSVVHAEAFASFAYLLSGGFAKPAFYPRAALGAIAAVDGVLSRVPRLFGARCIVVLTAA